MSEGNKGVRTYSVTWSLALAGCVSLLSGCGTLLSFNAMGPYDSHVYGGTRVDIEMIKDGFAGQSWFLTLFALDVPFSLVADTVLLPITVTHHFSIKKKDDSTEAR